MLDIEIVFKNSCGRKTFLYCLNYLLSSVSLKRWDLCPAELFEIETSTCLKCHDVLKVSTLKTSPLWMKRKLCGSSSFLLRCSQQDTKNSKVRELLIIESSKTTFQSCDKEKSQPSSSSRVYCMQRMLAIHECLERTMMQKDWNLQSTKSARKKQSKKLQASSLTAYNFVLWSAQKL